MLAMPFSLRAAVKEVQDISFLTARVFVGSLSAPVLRSRYPRSNGIDRRGLATCGHADGILYRRRPHASIGKHTGTIRRHGSNGLCGRRLARARTRPRDWVADGCGTVRIRNGVGTGLHACDRTGQRDARSGNRSDQETGRAPGGGNDDHDADTHHCGGRCGNPGRVGRFDLDVCGSAATSTSSSAFDGLENIDIFGGLLKPLVFGTIIALVGCHCGLRTYGGTQGVGRSTTQAVVNASVLILLFDFLLSRSS